MQGFQEKVSVRTACHNEAVWQSCMRLAEENIAANHGAVHLPNEERAAHGGTLAHLRKRRVAAAVHMRKATLHQTLSETLACCGVAVCKEAVAPASDSSSKLRRQQLQVGRIVGTWRKQNRRPM